MQVTFTDNIDSVVRASARLHPQFQFACAVALTKAVKQAQAGMYSHMSSVFDAPTPFTMRSLFVKPATKYNLVASVQLKDKFPSKASITPDELYGHQVTGGPRRHSRLEGALRAAGMISSGEFMVPGGGARLDAYGNMSRGQVAQVMSQLRLGLDPSSWKSKSRRSLAHQKKAGLMFWSRGGHLKRGIWMRKGHGVIPIMLVTGATNYKPRAVRINEVADDIVKANLPRLIDESFRAAVASSR
jgi:hypothetical protein